MNLRLGLVFVSLSIFVCPAAAEWSGVGGAAEDGNVSENAGRSEYPHLVVGADEHPFVAWNDRTSGTNEVYLRQWDGTAWTELGGSGSGGGVSNGGPGTYMAISCLRLDASGTPWIGYGNTYTPSVYIRRWTGSGWEGLGGSDEAGGLRRPLEPAAGGPQIAFDSDGNPVVAYGSFVDGHGQVWLRRWNGSEWVGLGGSDSGGGVSGSSNNISRLQLCVGTDGLPVVAWADVGTTSCIRLKKWTGTAWVGLGGSDTGDGVSAGTVNGYWPTMILGADGQPIVAWLVPVIGVTTSKIYMRKWDGAAWVEIGGSASGNGIRYPVPHFPNVSLALTAEGHPAVAWEENDAETSSLDVALLAFDGSTWSEIGNSAGEGGISATTTESKYPSVAFDVTGRPWVAWSENLSPAAEVFVKRFEPPQPTCLVLEQRDTLGLTLIPVGGVTLDSCVVIRACTSEAEPLRLEVEAALVGEAFTGIADVSSELTVSGMLSTVSLPTEPGATHWQARWVDRWGVKHPWMSFGGNAEGSADLTR